MEKEYKVNPDGTITWVNKLTLKPLEVDVELSEDFMEYDDHKLFK